MGVKIHCQMSRRQEGHNLKAKQGLLNYWLMIFGPLMVAETLSAPDGANQNMLFCITDENCQMRLLVPVSAEIRFLCSSMWHNYVCPMS